MKLPPSLAFKRLVWWVMAVSPSPTVGYSGTPLWKKLGFKTAMKVMVLNAPPHYSDLFVDSANDWFHVKKDADTIHLFISETKELTEITRLAKFIPPAAKLWVSWPKKRPHSQKA